MTLRIFRMCVSFGVLFFPIFATVGVLLGLNFHSESAYGHPLFTGDYNGGAGSGGGGSSGGGGGGGSGSGNIPAAPKDNGISEYQFCNKSIGVTPPTDGQQYTFNPNQWGWTEGTEGSLCLNITTFNNQSYATDTTAPAFSVTWKYPQGPDTQPVHAFPNVEMKNSKTLPVALGDLSAFAVNIEWTYALGNDTSTTPATDTAMTAGSVNSNVAFDIFADSDKTKAANTTEAAFEIMAWLADYGAATQPIGYSDGIAATETVNGTTFHLYYGSNSNNQTVCTWIASSTTNSFAGDIAPLFTSLLTLDKTTVPAKADYIGYASFGSEALYSDEFVTLSVPSLSMAITKS